MTPAVPRPLLIDRFAPRADFGRTSHVLVDADPDTAYRAVRDLDFGAVHGLVLDVALWLRALPGFLRGRRPTRTTPHDVVPGTGWAPLGEIPRAEVVFGAVGAFWQPVVHWRDVEARDFVDFAEPGYAKVVCSLSVLPYGQRRAVVTFETRATLTDSRSWSRFRRYWRLVGPFTALLERTALRSVKRQAERGALR
ncbi:hypothetical protein [Saccharothrix longispora]|uniref:hypothetical protein n=1 Tax=Saccharothrix longispora TaxID=33920 RepID=UPI0028FD317C|nr:hypothetical protein [Saccharothrix longispora]MBY8849541.1 hypothetical protein [Saccharothrix sp. MB29]MDU0289881.1 hypothetical protein [Saccharothrix longispora]